MGELQEKLRVAYPQRKLEITAEGLKRIIKLASYARHGATVMINGDHVLLTRHGDIAEDYEENTVLIPFDPQKEVILERDE